MTNMKEFRNKQMKKAMQALRKDENPITIENMKNVLVTTRLLVPAQWDKEPKTVNKQMVFDPDTQFQLMVITDQEGNCYYPMFTDMDELLKWDTERNVQSLVLTFDQYVPFIEMSKDSIYGIVINPYSESIPLSCQYILDMQKERMENLTKDSIEDDSDLRDPVANITDMKNCLCALGEKYTEIQSIYVKERLVKNQPSHWFVVVDMNPENPKLFQILGEACRSVSKGKGIEFLFGNTPLGKQIMANNEPVYKAV